MWGSNMMDWHTHNVGIWWWLATSTFWVVVVALLVIAIVVSLKWTGLLHSTKQNDEDPATAILKARFARGEITTEQFDQMRRKITEPDDSLDRA